MAIICLRCGQCCIVSLVAIIKPECIDDVLDFESETILDKIMHKPDGPCPHLEWNDNKAICKIHDKPWYKKTPCYSHNQIPDNTKCRTGLYFSKPENVSRVENYF